jgi:hypothetical protein
MTTLSNVNQVVQQGSNALETQNVRGQGHESSQVAAARMQEKDAQQLTTVQQFNESDKTRFDNSKSKGRQRQRKRKAKKRHMSSNENYLVRRGNLLDTIA